MKKLLILLGLIAVAMACNYIRGTVRQVKQTENVKKAYENSAQESLDTSKLSGN